MMCKGFSPVLLEIVACDAQDTNIGFTACCRVFHAYSVQYIYTCRNRRALENTFV